MDKEQVLSKPQVQIVKLDEFYLIGIPVTVSFKEGDAGRIGKTRELFMQRKPEIPGALHPGRYVCPHFSSETLFTYFYCMEVSDLRTIPDGMVGFTVPARTYGKVRCGSDPYKVLHTYLKEEGLQNDPGALALEFFSFDTPESFEHGDIYIPVKEEIA